MQNLRAIIAVLISIATLSPTSAQDAKPDAKPTVVERQAQGVSGRNIRVAVFMNRQPDCTSGPLPVIRLVEEPANGAVQIRRARIRVTNDKKCLAAEFPAYVAFYRSRPEFSGKDMLSLEIKNERGVVVEIRRIIVMVKAQGQEL